LVLHEATKRAKVGIALTSCRVPAAGKPTFDPAEDEMEVGVAIHGEPGRRGVKLRPAAEVAGEMVGAISTDLGARATDEAILLINGFGGTPLSELYLMYEAVRKLLEPAGTVVARSLVGNFVTSLDMAGCSMAVSMLDEEMRRLWDAAVHSAALRWEM
jgi:phosphoenolpyruvate---glycerone phosphotransferase subunit DhaK